MVKRYFVLVLRRLVEHISELVIFITFFPKQKKKWHFIFYICIRKTFSLFSMLLVRLDAATPTYIFIRFFVCALNFKRNLLWNICTVLFAVAVYNLWQVYLSHKSKFYSMGDGEGKKNKFVCRKVQLLVCIP